MRVGITPDEAVAQDDPVRVLERILGEMDWSKWEARYNGRLGQPAIHPRLLAGSLLYGLMKGIRTTRALEDATRHRVDFMWFLERRTFNHTTFSNSRKEFKAEIKDLNRQLSRAICLERAKEAKALLEMVIDGTRLRASSNRLGALTAETPEWVVAEVEKALSEKIDPNLLSQFPTDAARDLSAKDPQQVRQAAVKQISELQKRVKEAREDSKFKGLEDLQQRLQHLKSPDAGPAKGLAQQLAKGEFGKAAAALEALQKQLADQNLTPEQRRQLGQNLADLARQLEKLAQQQWKMENELKKLGLKPELAKDLKKLEESLKKLPMDAEQRKSLMEMAKANQAACKSCSQMSEALNSAASAMQSGSESPESLAEAKDQLSELESLSQQLEMTQATLADLGKAMRKFGEGNCPNCGGEGCEYCEGGGGKGEWAEGEPESEGSGSGGPGIGRGSVTDVKATDTKSDKTKVQGKSDSGPIIASWYVQGNKVKGESTKTFSQVAGEAAQEAAEAIETQHVPREYQDAVKNYFSQLQKSTEASTTEKGK